MRRKQAAGIVCVAVLGVFPAAVTRGNSLQTGHGAQALGERVFTISTDSIFKTSALGGIVVSQNPWLPGPLRLEAGEPDANGVATLTLAEDAIIGYGVIDGSVVCFKLLASTLTGSIDCDGGTSYDVLVTQNSNGAGVEDPPELMTGLGSDGGPGAAAFRVMLRGVNLPFPMTPDACPTTTYPDTGNEVAFTTTTARGMILNPKQGGNLETSRTGENFDCATWTQTDSAGELVLPVPGLDTIVGDTINVLALSDVLRGDTNQDDMVDSADVDGVVAAIFAPTGPFAADVNRDRVINAADVSALLRLL